MNRFYIGATQTCVQERILKHNTAAYRPMNYSAKANDWSLFLDIKVNDYPHAIRLEKKIKSMKSSKYIKNLKLYPELIDKIINKVST